MAKTQPASEKVKAAIPSIQPEPLAELSEEERVEWRKFTTRLPADWFPPETWPMLAQLCRHICQTRWVGQCLQEIRAGCLLDLDKAELERLRLLEGLHERGGRAMTALMVKLRITSQQRIEDDGTAIRARAAASQQPEVPPWMSAAPIAPGSERKQ